MLRRISLDAIDVEILRLLSEDCSMTIREISEIVGVSVPVVRKRIRRMRSWGLLRGCKALIDPEVVGAVTYLIVFEARSGQQAKSIAGIGEVEKVYFSTSKKIGAIIARTLDIKGLDHVSRKLEELGCRIVNTALIDVEYSERVWTPERPGETLRPKCAFCKKPIIGEPYIVTLKDGSTLLFSSEECAKAYFILKQGKHTGV